MFTLFDLLEEAVAEPEIDREYAYIPREAPKTRAFYDFDCNYEETA